MIRFSFAKDIDALLKGAETLLVVGSEKVWTDKAFPARLFRKKTLRDALLKAAKGTKPGALGATGGGFYKGPDRVVAGVLSDALSRHNSPARPDGIHTVVSGAALDKGKKSAIILILDDPSHQVAALNAIGRAYPMFTRKTGKKPSTRIHILAIDRAGQQMDISPVARLTMDAARDAARLVDSPPTAMNPEGLSNEVRSLLDGIDNVSIEEYVGDELIEAGLHGIHSVGRTALSAPRMLVARYEPENAKGKHIALVGKGVTFDTGGLHLKGRGNIETMKCDMGGAAAVSGAFKVLAASGCQRRITLVVCMAENAIGPGSYKPDDIIDMHSGKTVEINNTDAEGRLLLGDGVSYAARVLKASVILDAATLTGAQMVATGTHYAGIMSNDGDLEAALVAAGRRSGDLAHPLPFAPEFYKVEFKSPVADMRNSVKNRMNAQSSCAGQFVYNHIETTKAVWGHVDLAGPAFRSDRGTGYGVALLSDLVANLA